MSGIDKILEKLNKEQFKAVKSERQRNLILAGAGSGKTQVLTSRIAYLISIGVEPTSILSVTFTNKAAKDMKKRILNILSSLDMDEDASLIDKDLTVGTFHSFGNKFLRRHASEAGLERDFTVIDQDQHKALIKEIITEKLNLFSYISDKKEKSKEEANAIQLTMKYIGDCKDNGLRPLRKRKQLADNTTESYYLKRYDQTDKEAVAFTADEENFFGFNVAHVYKVYEDEKDKMKSLDFGDLILSTVELLFKNNSLRNHYKNEFHHILVDEFQDTNTIQSKLIELLHNKNDGYLFVVGDDDQSIYEWRGANIENILNFDKQYKDTLIIRLEQNYRSTNNILKCANKVISKNKKRKGKNLWSEKPDGDLIKVHQSLNAYEEAEKIALEIKRGLRTGKTPKDYAILYRSNYLSRVIESKLNEHQISYTIIGGLGFWSRAEIKDLMSYLTLGVNVDNNLAFDRIVNLPSRGLGNKKIEAIKSEAIESNVSRFQALKNLLERKEIKGQAAKNSQKFVDMIEASSDETLSLSDKLSFLLENSELIQFYNEKDAEKASEREANLVELINAAEHFNNENYLEESDEIAFISYAVLQSANDKDTEEETVPLMTIHASKGLEFKNVFLMGMEDGVFPSDASIRENKLEEERRLAYVAITRAEENLSISCTSSRYPGSINMMSRFIGEMPSELLIITKDEASGNKINNFYNKQKPNTSNWNKSRIISGYKIGANFEHARYGKGVITKVVDHGEEFEIAVKFGGMLGTKRFLVEKK